MQFYSAKTRCQGICNEERTSTLPATDASKVASSEFRRALSQFPTGVTVVSTLDASGEPVGVTASSFNSVSMEPPLVLWSLAKSALSYQAFTNAEFFVVNLLSKHQTHLSNKFAQQGNDKFQGVSWDCGIGGCPVLNETAGHFECRTWQQYDGGDHMIFVGEVDGFRFNESVMPLVFSRGSYSVATPQPVERASRDIETQSNGFLSNFLLYLLHQAHAGYAAELYPILLEECGVYPEEWRILTLLADTQSLRVTDLAEMVMQPEAECQESVQRLVERDYLVIEPDGVLRINSEGSNIAAKLFAHAKSHEQTVLGSLSQTQREHLLPSLLGIIGAFSPPAGTKKLREARK